MLRVEQLKYSIGHRTILDGINFHFRPNTVTCLLGGNGSGKTTLFNLISGFLPIKSGNIYLGKRNIRGLPPYRISRMGLAR